MLPEATNNPADWAMFTTAIIKQYLGCETTKRYCCADIQCLVEDYQKKEMHSQDDLGEYTRKFLKVSALLIMNKKIAKIEQDMFYISGFPTSIKDRICHCLTIVKLDLHLDDPYPMDDVVAVAKFLLTGSALRYSISNSLSHQQCLQQQPHYSQLVASVLSFNLALAMKAESNFAAHPPVCGFCAKLGHWIYCILALRAWSILTLERLFEALLADFVCQMVWTFCTSQVVAVSRTALTMPLPLDSLPLHLHLLSQGINPLILVLIFFLCHMTHLLFWK